MLPDVPRRPWKVGIRIATCQTSMPRSMHILWSTEDYRSLGKIDAKDVELFPEQVGLWILSLESVDYSRTTGWILLPQSVVGKKKNLYEQNFDGEANWPSVVNFHCMQIECCDKHADYFRRWLNKAPSSSRFRILAIMYFLSNRSPWFSSIYARVRNKIVEYAMKSKYRPSKKWDEKNF